MGGALGAVLTGVFAAAVWGGTDGLIAGNSDLFVENIIGVIARGCGILGGRHVTRPAEGHRRDGRSPGVGDEESEGLDTNLHGEEGYHMGGAGALTGSE